MEKGLEEIVETGRMVYVPDTNVLILQPLAPHILTNDWDAVAEDKYGRELVERHAKERELDLTPNDLVILNLVEEELDDVMHNPKKEEFKGLAARARSILYNIRKAGQKALGDGASVVELQNGANVYFIEHDETAYELDARLKKADQRIVWNFGRLAYANREMPFSFRFVSQDKYCRSKVRDEITRRFAGMPDQEKRTAECEEEFRFENASEDPHQTYPGVVRIIGSEEDYALFAQGMLPIEPKEERIRQLRQVELRPNQFIELQCGPRKIALVVSHEGAFAQDLSNYQEFMAHVREEERKGPSGDEGVSGDADDAVAVPSDVTRKALDDLIVSSGLPSADMQKVRNMITGKRKRKQSPADLYPQVVERIRDLKERQEYRSGSIGLVLSPKLVPVAEQVYALESLMNPEVHAVSLVGPQGCGKTLWTVYAALAQIEMGRFSRLVYYKTPRGMNKGHGFLPGGERQKIDPWTHPCVDALMEILGGNDGGPQERQKCKDRIDRLEREGMLLYGIDTYQQGRTWPGTDFVVIDEAQNYKRDELKLLLGRAGQGTKVVVLGDPDQIGATEEVTHWFLNRRNTGLSHLIGTYQGKKRYAHVTLSSPEVIKRSEIALYAREL